MVGLITFHAAHNYGSVLQAFATQKTLDKFGYNNEIINYRLVNQMKYYNYIYTTYFGYKELVKNLLRLPENTMRSSRNKKFEDFIYNGLRLSKETYHTYNDLVNARLEYPILISGSDQVWNKYCPAEFKKEPKESIYAYFLNFGREDARRISISSSFGNSKIDDIQEYKEFLSKYDVLSVREKDGAEMLHELTGKDVECTIDPTLLMSKAEWHIEGTYDVDKKYIFVYTLRRKDAVNELLESVYEIFGGSEYEIICIAPFSPIKVKGITNFADCGPLDFLSYIRCASLVITDSFHGTAFSLNFEVPFYSIQYGADKRKEQLLDMLGQRSRLLPDVSDIKSIDTSRCFEVDFSGTSSALNNERDRCLSFIRNSVGRYYIEYEG